MRFPAVKCMFVSIVFVAPLAVSCGGSSEADQLCEDARALYQKLKEPTENPDRNGDGTVSVTEQVLFDGTLESNQEFLDDFVAEWYELGGCDLD
jgi:hypothetical protein